MAKNPQDPHYRPEVVDPSEYQWCGMADHAPHKNVEFILVRHDLLARNGIETGTSDPYSVATVPFHQHGEGNPNFQCHHCHKRGKGIRYFILFLHKPTREVVIFGRDCAERFNMATKSQLNIEARRDEYLRISRWIDSHIPEYEFLSEYGAQQEWRNEFFDSLWERLQREGSISDGQVNGLRKWIANGKPWAAREISPEEADAKRSRVTHINEPSTTEQVKYILKLWDQVRKGQQRPYVKELTRVEAEALINELKAERANGPMSDNQRALINRLMEERRMAPEKRQEARRQLDSGLTYEQASRWIDKLQTLEAI